MRPSSPCPNGVDVVGDPRRALVANGLHHAGVQLGRIVADAGGSVGNPKEHAERFPVALHRASRELAGVNLGEPVRNPELGTILEAQVMPLREAAGQGREVEPEVLISLLGRGAFCERTNPPGTTVNPAIPTPLAQGQTEAWRCHGVRRSVRRVPLLTRFYRAIRAIMYRFSRPVHSTTLAHLRSRESTGKTVRFLAASLTRPDCTTGRKVTKNAQLCTPSVRRGVRRCAARTQPTGD